MTLPFIPPSARYEVQADDDHNRKKWVDALSLTGSQQHSASAMAVYVKHVFLTCAEADGADYVVIPFIGIYGTPALADLDDDRDLDLVLGQGDGTLDYYENVGSAATPVFVQDWDELLAAPASV